MVPRYIRAADKTCCSLALLTLLLFWTLLPLKQAYANYAVTLDSGYGLEDTKLWRLNFSLGNEKRYPTGNGWYWIRNWEGNLSYWYLQKNIRGEKRLLEAGITPNFRLAREQQWSWGWRPYLEGGLGIHLLSRIHIGTRNLGSAFQFGTHAGLGVRFGSNEQYDLAWRIEHLSNAGLREPNPGINFTMVRVGYRW